MAKKIEFKFKTPNESPGYLLGQLTLLWQRKLKKVLDPLNLTQTQFVLLAALGWLSRENNNVTQVDIANQGNADRMMVSKVLRTLEEKEFISRQEHQTDTRAKVIKLTDNGAKVLQKALTAVENADIDFFSVLGENLTLFNHHMINLTEQNKDD
ncbi:Transcriptional regulator SlyA [compost metagenome]|uniref:MarR family winged helix-turn-helix transcriptional regulator n=1 Tax=Pedobacter sp. ok626 TaxID=1761882 RepID=UPI00087F3397|nr:MarR family transcriptional regulator [Pedobacter sp. ok626]SDK63133.1 transcriptional regulator, MarR family [Pedobacter sp. ok626]